MPLLIDLKPGEKVIINGAVLENAGSNTKLRIHNESNILRQKEIMTDDEANSPAARIYFALQCAYIFPEKRDHYLGLYLSCLDDYLHAAPSAKEIGGGIHAAVTEGQYYRALRLSRKLLKHECATLDQLQTGFDKGDGAAG